MGNGSWSKGDTEVVPKDVIDSETINRNIMKIFKSKQINNNYDDDTLNWHTHSDKSRYNYFHGGVQLRNSYDQYNPEVLINTLRRQANENQYGGIPQGLESSDYKELSDDVLSILKRQIMQQTASENKSGLNNGLNGLNGGLNSGLNNGLNGGSNNLSATSPVNNLKNDEADYKEISDNVLNTLRKQIFQIPLNNIGGGCGCDGNTPSATSPVPVDYSVLKGGARKDNDSDSEDDKDKDKNKDENKNENKDEENDDIMEEDEELEIEDEDEENEDKKDKKERKEKKDKKYKSQKHNTDSSQSGGLDDIIKPFYSSDSDYYDIKQRSGRFN